jgi:hypothetical protein
VQETRKELRTEVIPAESAEAENYALEGEVVAQANPVPASDEQLLHEGPRARHQKKAVRLYVFLPMIFLTVTLLGGLRLASPDGAFVFVAPALICLIFAVVLMATFFRGRLIAFDGWFSDEFSTLHDASNAAVLVTLFAATSQVFNSVIPEAGLPFWVVTFCFAWTLWNNLFADLDNKKLLKGVSALFAFAFAAKYIILAALTAPAAEEGWLRSVIADPGREALTWVLDLPRYTAGTGYIQFFCLLLYFIGLYLLPPKADLEMEK